MALLIPDYPDPENVAEAPIAEAYAWIGDLSLSYSNGTARFVVWFHRSMAAASTWPSGDRIKVVETLAIYCGGEVPGFPGVVFPTLDEVMARAVEVASAWMAEAGDDEAAIAAVLASVATGRAIRASLYASVNELIFPDATEVD